MRLELFATVLLRVAGGALADMRRIELLATLAAVAALQDTYKKTTQTGAVISDELHTVIPSIADDQMRRFWLGIRRDMYNNRPLRPVTPQAYTELPPALRKKVRSYIRLRAQIEPLQKEIARHYSQETAAARRAFKELLRQNTNLQNGLLLSSSSIGESLEKYLAPDTVEGASITKKERSFMEYLSRLYTKPSPFSSFTHVSTATFSGGSSQLITFSDFRAGSHVHLSQNIYRYLHGLLMNRPEIRQLLPITLNSTIKKTDAYRFLANHDICEAFQRIAANPLLDIIYAIASKARRPINCRELAARLAPYIDAPAPEVIDYLDQLVGFGFFELELGVSGMERDWDKKLSRRLAELAGQCPPLEELIAGLAELQKQTKQYQKASLQKRQQLRASAFQTLRTACAAAGASFEKPKSGQPEDGIFRRTYPTSFQFKPHQLWYEDTTLAARPTVSPQIRQRLNVLGDLLARTRDLDPCQAKQENMADFFKNSYGASAVVDLLQFYKDYSHNKKGDSADATTARLKKNKHALDFFLKNAGTPTANRTVNFDQTALANLPPSETSVSFDAFVQTYQQNGEAMLVFNHAFEGSGRMFTRFLYLFEGLTEELRHACNASSGNRIFAEAADTSFFDGNVHPRIMPYEIVIPGGHAMLPRSAQIEINDLMVTYSASAPGQLILTHRPSGKEVFVFDLGVQAESGRSKLYNFLCKFGPSLHHRPNALLEKINERDATQTLGGNVTVLPRVVYEHCIVLQRKTWETPWQNLPARTAAETDWDYFLRLQQWRLGLQIPDEVFIKDTLRKPQYINFGNPFLVAIFESVVRNCQGALQIQEMLPNSKQLAATGGRAVEFLAQWDRV